MTKYQLLPPLSEDEYASLFDDIAAGGVKVPIDIDEDGEILDGHHRKRVCDELGIECPTRVVELPEAAKADYALTVNLARRHLDRMQRRQLVVNSLKLDYRLGDRVHARRCGVDHKTVTSIRSDLVAVGEIPHLTERQGADGKTYPAAKTPPALADPENGKEGATEDGGPVAPSTPLEPQDHPTPPSGDAAEPSSHGAGELGDEADEETSDSSTAAQPEAQASAGVSSPASPVTGKDEDDPERIEREMRTRMSERFCESIVTLSQGAAGGDPIHWLEEIYLPGAYKMRGLPGVNECFEAEALRLLASRIYMMADHVEETGLKLP